MSTPAADPGKSGWAVIRTVGKGATMPSVLRPAVACAVILLVLVAAACPPSPTDIHTAEMLFDLSDALNGLRQDIALVQDQVDSLRLAVARQDSLISRLAQSAGVPLQ